MTSARNQTSRLQNPWGHLTPSHQLKIFDLNLLNWHIDCKWYLIQQIYHINVKSRGNKYNQEQFIHNRREMMHNISRVNARLSASVLIAHHNINRRKKRALFYLVWYIKDAFLNLLKDLGSSLCECLLTRKQVKLITKRILIKISYLDFSPNVEEPLRHFGLFLLMPPWIEVHFLLQTVLPPLCLQPFGEQGRFYSRQVLLSYSGLHVVVHLPASLQDD